MPSTSRSDCPSQITTKIKDTVEGSNVLNRMKSKAAGSTSEPTFGSLRYIRFGHVLLGNRQFSWVPGPQTSYEDFTISLLRSKEGQRSEEDSTALEQEALIDYEIRPIVDTLVVTEACGEVIRNPNGVSNGTKWKGDVSARGYRTEVEFQRGQSDLSQGLEEFLLNISVEKPA